MTHRMDRGAASPKSSPNYLVTDTHLGPEYRPLLTQPEYEDLPLLMLPWPSHLLSDCTAFE